MQRTSLKVALGQLRVDGGQPKVNLKRALDMITEAGNRGCDIIVLPECLDLGWTDASAHDLAQPIPGEYSQQLCEAARSAAIHVVAGLVERDGDALYNSAILISAAGEILLKHCKINELEIAQKLYSRGTSLSVAHTEMGCIGITICADNFPNSLMLAQSLRQMGAQLLLSPSAWAVDADHDNQREPYGDLWRESYTLLAHDFELPVIGVSNVGWVRTGPWAGKKCIGCSLAMGRDAEVLAQGNYGEDAEQLLVVEIDLRQAQ